MFKRAIYRFSLQNSTASILSMIASLIAIVGICLYAKATFAAFLASPTDTLLQFQAMGSIVIVIILLRSISADIWNILEPGTKLETGTAIRGTPYDFFKFFDTKCNEAIIIGQNLRTLLDDPKSLPHLKNLLSTNSTLSITIVLSVPEIMKSVSQHAETQHIQSTRELREFYYSLPPQERTRITIKFHPGTTALSAFIRDTRSAGRGTIVFTPKWSTDLEPTNRIYCVVRKWKDKEIFDKLIGHLPILIGTEAITLDEMARRLNC